MYVDTVLRVFSSRWSASSFCWSLFSSLWNVSTCSHGSEFMLEQETNGGWMVFVTQQIIKDLFSYAQHHAAFIIFFHNNRWCRNTKCGQLHYCRHASILFLKTPPTRLWFLVQAGTTVCPVREDATADTAAVKRRPTVAPTCSLEQCQAHFPGGLVHRECDATWKKCSVKILEQAKETARFSKNRTDECFGDGSAFIALPYRKLLHVFGLENCANWFNSKHDSAV